MKAVLIFGLTYLVQNAFGHLLHDLHRDHPHHGLHDLFDRCSNCEIKWIPGPQAMYKGANPNSRVCKAYVDRWIGGELHMHLDGTGRRFCKVPYYNGVRNVYDFQVLAINAKEIRVQSEGAVGSLTQDENYSVRDEETCSKSKLEELIEKIKEHHDKKHDH